MISLVSAHHFLSLYLTMFLLIRALCLVTRASFRNFQLAESSAHLCKKALLLLRVLVCFRRTFPRTLICAHFPFFIRGVSRTAFLFNRVPTIGLPFCLLLSWLFLSRAWTVGQHRISLSLPGKRLQPKLTRLVHLRSHGLGGGTFVGRSLIVLIFTQRICRSGRAQIQTIVLLIL